MQEFCNKNNLLCYYQTLFVAVPFIFIKLIFSFNYETWKFINI